MASSYTSQQLQNAVEYIKANLDAVLLPRLILSAFGKRRVVSQSITPRCKSTSVEHTVALNGGSPFTVAFRPNLPKLPIFILDGDLILPAEKPAKPYKQAVERLNGAISSASQLQLPKLTFDRKLLSELQSECRVYSVATDSQLRTAEVAAIGVANTLLGRSTVCSKSGYEAGRCSFRNAWRELSDKQLANAPAMWIGAMSSLLAGCFNGSESERSTAAIVALINAVDAVSHLKLIPSESSGGADSLNAASSRGPTINLLEQLQAASGSADSPKV